MNQLTVFNSVTLDGVMQAPGRPDEDRRGGFQHGGWAAPYFDEVMLEVAGEGMAAPHALLLGRRTYQDFYSFWPHQPENPFSEVLENSHKYVASATLREPLRWANSTLLSGDVVQAVAELKANSEKDLVVLGSGVLVRSLMPHGLIDQYVLQIHPLVLGSGRRLFIEGSPQASFRLGDTRVTSTGVVIATYQQSATADERQ